MRLERKSLIAVTLLLMAGCSASRQARESKKAYDSPDPVPMPMRHADQYDSGARAYEYDTPSPSPSDSFNRPGTPVPPPVPMREPAFAPPAIGVSRVKSVSWPRGIYNRPDRNSCTDNSSQEGCSTGQQSQLPPGYFEEGCFTPPRTAARPSLRDREKTTLLEMMQGWNLRAKTRRANRVETSRNCGELNAVDAGCVAPQGCTTSVNGNPSVQSSPRGMKQYIGGNSVAPGQDYHGKNRGSLADPLQEDGWEERGTPDHQRFSPDEMLDLPPEHEAPVREYRPKNVPAVPKGEPMPELPMPVLPMPKSTPRLIPAPPIQNPAPQAAAPPQVNTDSTKRIVQPPMWPRLGTSAAPTNNFPVANPTRVDDSSLPTIQPGRRI